MQTRLSQSLLDTPIGREADQILRRCVHCGFCNATCPTFRLTGNELEGPRGRIYLVKGLLEGEAASRRTLSHLDHCLGCRACETTCPSGVNFHRLADIGREKLAAAGLRPWWDRVRRRLASRFFNRSLLFRALIAIGRWLRPILPAALARQIPRDRPSPWMTPERETAYVMLHEGCVQPVLAPAINAAAASVLARRGIGSRRAEGCCGALAYHLDDIDRAMQQIRTNIDAWWPAMERGHGLVVTASGCAAFLKDYGRLCQEDPEYRDRAEKLASKVADVSDFLEPLQQPARSSVGPIVLHVPCTLRNALRGDDRIRQLLAASGVEMAETADDGQCCGSAGAYSLLHPETSRRLRDSKLGQLQPASPECIVTANIGCLSHLAAGTAIPVRHWVEIWNDLET